MAWYSRLTTKQKQLKQHLETMTLRFTQLQSTSRFVWQGQLEKSRFGILISLSTWKHLCLAKFVKCRFRLTVWMWFVVQWTAALRLLTWQTRKIRKVTAILWCTLTATLSCRWITMCLRTSLSLAAKTVQSNFGPCTTCKTQSFSSQKSTSPFA